MKPSIHFCFTYDGNDGTPWRCLEAAIDIDTAEWRVPAVVIAAMSNLWACGGLANIAGCAGKIEWGGPLGGRGMVGVDDTTTGGVEFSIGDACEKWGLWLMLLVDGGDDNKLDEFFCCSCFIWSIELVTVMSIPREVCGELTGKPPFGLAWGL